MTLSVRTRTVILSALLTWMTTVSAAYGHGGSSTFLGQYFLPADVQAQGVSGIVFGVLAPVGIVLILFYIALQTVFPNHPREAKALAVLLSLFTIPSGAYKTISGLIINVMGVAGGSAPRAGDLIFGFQQMELIAILAGLGAGAAVLKVVMESGEGLEIGLLGGGLVGILVYMSLLGQVNPISAVFSLVMIYAGYRIFQTGVTSSSRPGMIIGLMGLVFLTWAVRSAEFAPDEIQQMVGSFRIFAYIIIFLLIITMIVNIVFKGALLGGAMGGGGGGGGS